MAPLPAMLGVLTLAAASIETRVPAGAPCVTQAELRQALEGAAAPRSAVASVTPAPDAKLLLRVAWADGQKIERRVPVDPADCGAVKRVVATLIRTWLEHPPPADQRAAAEGVPPARSTLVREAQLATAAGSPPVPAGPGARLPVAANNVPSIEPPADARETAPSARATRRPASDATTSATSEATTSATREATTSATREATTSATSEATTPVGDAASSGAPASDATTQGDVAASPAQPAAGAAPPASARAESPPTVMTSPAAPSAQAGRSWALTAAVLGGVSGGPTPVAVPAGQLAVELDITRFGAGLDVGLEGTRTVDGAHGSAFVSQSWLTLSGKFRQPLGRWLALTALLGVRGYYIRAGANGFTTTRTADLFGAGPALSLGAEVMLGPVTLMLRAIGALRFPAETLVVDGLGDVMTLKIGQACLVAGLGWRF